MRAIFQVLNPNCSWVYTKYSNLASSPNFTVQRYTCKVHELCRLPGTSGVTGRQSLCSCFLQLNLSTSLSGKYYWLIRANCWQTPDSLWGEERSQAAGRSAMGEVRIACQAGGCTFNHSYNWLTATGNLTFSLIRNRADEIPLLPSLQSVAMWIMPLHMCIYLSALGMLLMLLWLM